MKAIDLFAGCGGMSLGFKNAGIDIVASFDNWRPAIEVYRRNFEHPVFEKDLSKGDVEDILKQYTADIIIGGPPCQDFSSAGKRDELQGRADLTISFANIISTLRPEWFVMENVERITKSSLLQKAIQIFKDHGYGLTAKVLDASFCGVPQARKRYFLIGCQNQKDNFLQYFLEKNLAKQPMTIYDYLGNSLGIEYYYRHPRSYQRRGIFSIHEPSPTIRGVNRPIPPTYIKHPGDVCDITDDLRALTTLERSYIQTFPREFRFEGNKSDVEQMIGNAVPVNLAKYVATAILEFCRQSNDKVGKEEQLQLNFR